MARARERQGSTVCPLLDCFASFSSFPSFFLPFCPSFLPLLLAFSTVNSGALPCAPRPRAGSVVCAAPLPLPVDKEGRGPAVGGRLSWLRGRLQEETHSLPLSQRRPQGGVYTGPLHPASSAPHRKRLAACFCSLPLLLLAVGAVARHRPPSAAAESSSYSWAVTCSGHNGGHRG